MCCTYNTQIASDDVPIKYTYLVKLKKKATGEWNQHALIDWFWLVFEHRDVVEKIFVLK